MFVGKFDLVAAMTVFQQATKHGSMDPAWKGVLRLRQRSDIVIRVDAFEFQARRRHKR